MPRLATETGVLLILREHAGLQDQYVLPEVLTQRGMAKLLEVAVPNLSRTLARMRESGLVYERLARIRGRPRKLRTYFATPAGLEAASRAWEGLRERPVTLGTSAGSEEVTLAELLLRAPLAGADRVRRIRDALAGPVILGDDLPAAMIGLEEVVGVVRAFLGGGHGRLLISGRAGMGKTTLVQAVLERFWSGALEWVVGARLPTPGALVILDDLVRGDARLQRLPKETHALLISRDPGVARDLGEPAPGTLLIGPLGEAAVRRYVAREGLAWEPKVFAELTGGVPLRMALLRGATPDGTVTTELALLPAELRLAMDRVAWLPDPLQREVFEDWFGPAVALEGLRRGAWALDREGRMRPHPLLVEQVTGEPPAPDLVSDLITDLRTAGLPLEAARLALAQDIDLASAVGDLESSLLEALAGEIRAWLSVQPSPDPVLLMHILEMFSSKWDPRMLQGLLDGVMERITDDALLSKGHDLRSRLAGRVSDRQAQLDAAIIAHGLAQGEERSRLGIRLLRLHGRLGDREALETLAAELQAEPLSPALVQALWTNLGHGRLAVGDEPGMRAAFATGLGVAVDRPRLLREYVAALIAAEDLEEAEDYLENLGRPGGAADPGVGVLWAAWHLARHEPLPALRLLRDLGDPGPGTTGQEADRLLIRALMDLGDHAAVAAEGGGHNLRPRERAFNLLSAAEGAAEDDPELAASLARQARKLVEDPKRREIIRLKEAEYAWPSPAAHQIAGRLANGAIDPRVREKAQALLDGPGGSA